ncbi:hypothetical protein J6590_026694 [Homalodisca vitripennis]|nr:hypothetical protein J6590_026694 [Homalodisca vitripennis]
MVDININDLESSTNNMFDELLTSFDIRRIINTGISDHTAQLYRLTLPVPCPNSNSSPRRHLNANNLLKLKQLLSDKSWHDVLSINDVEEAYKLDGVKVEDPMKVADHFNEHFTTIADETLKLNPPRSSLPKKINEHVNLHVLKELLSVTDHELMKTIGSLEIKTSSGLDEISTKIFKFCSEELGKPSIS